MTLDDETEITHSEMLQDGTVKVYLEKPDERDCFHRNMRGNSNDYFNNGSNPRGEDGACSEIAGKI